MNIQSFIFSHPYNWEQLLSSEPYFIKVKHYDDCPEFAMFNYDQIRSPQSDPIVCECRGLVLHIIPGEYPKVVRKGFNRFFNYGEPSASEIDWDSATATIKEDGTLVFASDFKGGFGWHIGTRQNFDLDNAPLNSVLHDSFGKLWDDVVASKYLACHTGNMVSGWTYCFELCTRENRVVIDYPEPKIFLLAIFENETGCELSRDIVLHEAKVLGVDAPTFYQMKSVDDYSAFVENFGIEHEGLVIKDHLDRRVKMKSKLYFEMHKTVSNGAMDLEAIVRLVRKGEQSEFLSYFPEYKELFDKVEHQVTEANKAIADIVEVAAKERASLSRKEFAMKHKDSTQSALWFKAYDGRLDDDFIMGISDEKYIGLFAVSLV